MRSKVTKSKLRIEKKNHLSDIWLQDMMSSLYSYSLRTQISQSVEDTKRILISIPYYERLPFIIGNPRGLKEKSKEITEEHSGPEEKKLKLESRKSERFKSKAVHTDLDHLEEIISADGRIKNVWYLPHWTEILNLLLDEALITQIRRLTAVLKVSLLLQQILNFILLRDVKSYQTSTELEDLQNQDVSLELKQLQNELNGLGKSSEEMVNFLSKKRDLLYYRMLLELSYLQDQFRERGDISAASEMARQLSRSIYSEAHVSFYSSYILLPCSEDEWMRHFQVDFPIKKFLYERSVEPVYEISVFGLNWIHANSGRFIGCRIEPDFANIQSCLWHLNEAQLNVARAQFMAVDIVLEDLLAENNVNSAVQPQVSEYLELYVFPSHFFGLTFSGSNHTSMEFRHQFPRYHSPQIRLLVAHPRIRFHGLQGAI